MFGFIVYFDSFGVALVKEISGFQEQLSYFKQGKTIYKSFKEAQEHAGLLNLF